MHHRIWALGVLSLLFASTPAWAAPVKVNLRVEGTGSTVYEGAVTTDGKTVTTAAGGAHKCDGTNGGTPNTPGGTPTTALDDASIANGFAWDGSYSGFVRRLPGRADRHGRRRRRSVHGQLLGPDRESGPGRRRRLPDPAERR